MKSYFQLLISLSLLLSVFLPMIASAHPGHGEASALSHELEHFLWLIAGVSVLALVFYYRIKNKN